MNRSTNTTGATAPVLIPGISENTAILPDSIAPMPPGVAMNGAMKNHAVSKSMK